MHSNQQDDYSRFKLAQIWNIASCIVGSTGEIDTIHRIVNEVLKDDFNINTKVTVHSRYPKDNFHLNDCGALHFVFCGSRVVDIFNTFLELGADFAMKNGNGQTVLHMIVMHYLRQIALSYHVPFIESVLSAHVKFQKTLNPHDNDGVSHLHGACITNHVESLKFFLENGASVNEAVNLKAPKYSGYTPLHFAAEFQSVEAARILLHRGANVNAKDAKGMTPLDISVKHRLDKFEYISQRDAMRDYEENYTRKISDSGKIVELLLKQQGVLTLGLPKFHVACSLKELTIAESLVDQVNDINQALSMESPPGDTALHFAAENSIEAVKLLVNRGAKIDVENAVGLTPLDACVNRYDIEDICDVLARDGNWSNVRMADEKIRLLDLVRATEHEEEFKLLLQNNVEDLAMSDDSLILPGCTFLHLAVIFSSKTKECKPWDKLYDDSIVKKCLEKGLDINAQNSRGQSPIHLAFRLGKENLVKLMLERLDEADEVVNLKDKDNLTYLHIACVHQVESLVEKLLRRSNPNAAYKGKSTLMGWIVSGSTPLHLATAKGSHTIAEILLRHGADLHAPDANDMTPIHWILHLDTENSQETATVLFDSLSDNLQDRVVKGVGLSYLHVACYAGNVDAIERLLDNGSKFNVAISYDNPSGHQRLNQLLKNLSKYSTYTPLHLAQIHDDIEGPAILLLRHGADLFAKVSSKEECWLYPLEDNRVTRLFTAVLWEEDDLQKRMEDRFGLTRLHIACHVKNEEAVQIALNEGIDVNAQVRADSEIFAGCTPLHLLMTLSKDRYDGEYDEWALIIEPMVKLLLDHGADVTIMNAKKETPLHIFSWNDRNFTDADRCKLLLPNAQRDFSINPVNSEGLSHFHLACQWHQPEVVKKFLQCGSVDVNRPVDYFARFNGGCTPLHLALNSKMTGPNDNWANLLQTVDMLLEHGADVNAKDVRGETPLHQPAVMRSPEMSILDNLTRHGADINSKTIKGKTPFDKQIDFLVNKPDYASLLRKYDYPINSWNNLTGQGSIAKIFAEHRGDVRGNTQFQNFIQSLDTRSLDELGRTVIHNSVAIAPLGYVVFEYYIYAFEVFIKQGVDIDHQDQSGQTALHYAARMENDNGVKALLAYGADFNIMDNNGKSALSYVAEYSERDISTIYSYQGVLEVLNLHVKQLQYLGLEVSQLNHDLSDDLQFYEDEDSNIPQLFFTQVEMAKTVDVGVGSLTLFDFLNDTGGVTLYPYLPISERAVIDDFFKSVSRQEFSELLGIIKLQFRKLKERLELIDPALASLRKLIGFSVPGLCEDILRFLFNSDLKNLIVSAEFEMRKRKRSTFEQDDF